MNIVATFQAIGVNAVVTGQVVRAIISGAGFQGIPGPGPEFQYSANGIDWHAEFATLADVFVRQRLSETEWSDTMPIPNRVVDQITGDRWEIIMRGGFLDQVKLIGVFAVMLLCLGANAEYLYSASGTCSQTVYMPGLTVPTPTSDTAAANKAFVLGSIPTNMATMDQLTATGTAAAAALQTHSTATDAHPGLFDPAGAAASAVVGLVTTSTLTSTLLGYSGTAHSHTYGSLTGTPTSWPWGDITGTPTSYPAYSLATTGSVGDVWSYTGTAGGQLWLAGDLSSSPYNATNWVIMPRNPALGQPARPNNIRDQFIGIDFVLGNLAIPPSWGEITDTPTSFTPDAHTQAFGTITGTPTSLSGYGITDAAPLAAVRHVFWPAGAFIPRTSTAPEFITSTSGTNYYVMFDGIAFDSATAEYATVTGNLEHWNGSTIKFRPVWTTTATNTGQTVSFKIQARAYADGDTIAQAYGTAVASTDTVQGANLVQIGPASAAITVAGNPANGNLLQLQIYRDVDNDDAAADAKLLGIWVGYTEASTQESAW